jgi:hypothetical protein
LNPFTEELPEALSVALMPAGLTSAPKPWPNWLNPELDVAEEVDFTPLTPELS